MSHKWLGAIMDNFGRSINCLPSSGFTVSIIDRDYVIKYWKKSNLPPIDYQLSLFCRKLFEDVWAFYPNFFDWIDRKFIPGLINGEREIVIISERGNLLGYSALKKTHKENKICTLYVKGFARNSGIGTILLNVSKIRLNEDRPLITVSEDRIELFESMFNKNNFKLVNSINNLYLDGKKEYVFNKEMTTDESSIVDKA
ncbi:TPA: GNAT family N-acetyltransferase [Vibrio vulnificus]|nr:GNAT family N-acetyltransferase [Vibrio vulnificus]